MRKIKNKLKVLLRRPLANLVGKAPLPWMPARRRQSLAASGQPALVTFPAAEVAVTPMPDGYREVYEQVVTSEWPLYHFEIPQRLGYRLSQATISMPESLVMTARGKIVDECLPTPHCLETMGVVLDFFRFKPTRRHARAGFVLGMPFQKNYHLWLHYALPRLASFHRMTGVDGADVPLLLSDNAPRFVRDSLAAYMRRNPGLTVEYLPEGRHVFADLYLMQPMSVRDMANPVAVDWLRRTFLDDALPPAAASGRRIYLTRKGALERNVLGEDSLTEFLAAQGFEIFNAGAFTFEQQVAAFRDAEVIVGPHGASLSNLAFATPGALVIEMVGGSHFMPCFTYLASQRGLRYAPVRLNDAGEHMVVTDAHVRRIAEILEREGIAAPVPEPA
jgi:hypothetical protein